MVTQTYNLNMVPDYGSVPVVVKASQYDDGDRVFHFRILDGDVLYSIPSGSNVKIQGTKPDGHGFSYGVDDLTEDGRHIVSFSGDTVAVICQLQMTAVPGNARTEIRIVTPTGDTGSANFVLKIEQSGLSTDTDISETEIPSIIELAKRQMQAAQAAAEAAAESEENAAGSAANSATSAAASAASAADALACERAAAQSATEACEAQAAAERAQAAAEGAEDGAKGWKEEAEAWAVGERNGVDVIDGDGTYRNNSKYYAGRSGQFAVEAEISAMSARESLGDLQQRIIDALGGSTPNAWIDFDTGNLMWEGGSFVFSVNETTGNLEWEVAA